MMKKLFILTLLIISFINLINSQNAYYITDNGKFSGIKIIDQASSLNYQSCAVVQKGKTIYFSPTEVSEYKLKKGNRFISENININGTNKQVFVEELTKGTVELFYYKDNDNKWIVVKKNNQTYELFKDKYKQTLKEVLTDCENAKHFIKETKFNRKSLARLIDSYENCNEVPMAFTKIGFNISLVGLNLQSSPYSSYEIISDVINSLSADYSFGIGFFIDFPIADKGFTFRPEINYSSFNFSNDDQFSFNKTYISKIKLDCNISSIKIPLSFQYTLYSKGFRPFVNLGTVFSYNIKNECNYNSDGGVTNPIELDIIRKSQMGVFGGLGAGFPIFKTKELFIQSRYTMLLGDKGVSFLKERYIEFSFGIKL